MIGFYIGLISCLYCFIDVGMLNWIILEVNDGY